MRTILPAYSISTEGRVRGSCGSLDRQTAQPQPSVGTPIDVPLPNTVSLAFMLPALIRGPSWVAANSGSSSSAGSRGSPRLRRTRQRVGHFHVGHAKLVEAVLQESFFRRGHVAFRLFRQQRKRVYGQAGADEVTSWLAALLVPQYHLQ